MVGQISVFMENKAGRLAEICDVIASANSNIRGFVINDTQQFGIVRFVLSNAGAAMDALSMKGFTITESKVLVLDLSSDRPGGLARVLSEINASGVNIEYAYSLVDRLLAIAVDDLHGAEEKIRGLNIDLLTQDDIDAL
jgi:hypothetical protein